MAEPAENPKTYEVEWARVARDDLAGIIEYIAAGRVANAGSLLARIEKRAQGLGVLPFRGRVVPELAAHGVQIYREIIEYPWRVIYRITGGTVHVLAVIDGRRNAEDILLERLIS